ncbi:galactonate dehydratase [Marinobacterium aestuarii]|uniref:Galactonate dehydratase n=1 Tax=Marinobacterium aestuarii TaxID=1821621 RepID=A0A1A9F145_9GAMM|nr:altronate dehydratase family protein [Marinobacterium aestuarii]ANG63812.1 galactonate dehydratase [Marinobacterium aestuarii]
MIISNVKKTALLNENDNVVLALEDIPRDAQLSSREVTATANIPRGHKVAVAAIKKGEAVVKYAQVIGFATTDIAPGDHVHNHNCAVEEFDRDYAFGTAVQEKTVDPTLAQRTFKGFVRTNGEVGTRNYIGIITSVNCSATVARLIADQVKNGGLLDKFDNVDGIVPLIHGAGCCIKSDGEGYQNLQRTLAGYARHANFAAVLIVGLGCEVMQIARLMDEAGLTEDERFQKLIIQDEGGTRKTVAAGVSIIESMLPAADACQRTEVPISHLTVALQCGGSDGYSGITANPALGVAADMLVAAGGTVVLSETPEIYGAEHLLTRRAASREVGDKLISLIHWWEDYASKNGGEMDNNPTPGNKLGGLTTIFEKSLGAIAKAGTTSLNGVYHYSEKIDTKGFVFMDGPGYDPCAITGQVASGSNLICFTTGRGSVFGYKPAPSIKLATNTDMYLKMEEDMDINCGDIISEQVSLEAKGREILELIIAVASGDRSKSELNGLGDHEFVPWQLGAQM